MAYTTIDKSGEHFNTVLYTGNNGAQTVTGVGFRPDWVWIKDRDGTERHCLTDSVRGVLKELRSNETAAESDRSSYGGVSAFNSDGFVLVHDDGYNDNGSLQVSWNWKAAGATPTQTYSVKVVSDGGNKYRFDNFGTSAVTIDLQEGGTYTFDQSDSSNSGHPLRFSTTSNGTHGGGSAYTTGVTVTGTPGNSGAKTVITVASSAPTLYYYCTVHSGMGGQANTNTTFGSSNFSGSIQSKVSANTTAGFSIVSWTGTGSNATIGHGLGSVPKMIMIKDRSNTRNWQVYHVGYGNGGSGQLNLTNAFSGDGMFQSTDPTSTVFSVGTSVNANASGANIISYCFADVKGYSKFGKYTGNGNADGTFVYTGFKPAMVIVKLSSGVNSWNIHDNKRDTFNVVDRKLEPNVSDAESDDSPKDYLSNGFKCRGTGGNLNASGSTYIYMAFAESPFVTSTGIPTTAR